jgi:NitT/TauT family transport system substrate-binding protein
MKQEVSMSKITITLRSIGSNNHGATWLIVFLLAGFVHPSFAQESSKKLLVGYSGLVSGNASLWIAEDLGLFKKHGLDVSAVFTGSGSVTSQALLAGEAKLVANSVGPTAGAAGGGGDLVIVAGLVQILPYQLWVQPQIKQPADLKGKSVAISTFGSGSHLAAEVALQTIGLDPARDKVAIMQIGAQPDRMAAVITGRVAATALEPGFGQVAKDKGLTMLTDLTKSDTPYVNTVIVSLRRYVKENPQLVENFLKGIVDGLAIMPSAANEKAVKNVLAKRLKLTTPESIQVIYDATVQMHANTKVPNAPVGGIQNMVDALHRVNPRLAKVKAGDLVDNSFVERLEKSGYVAEAMKKSR